MKKLLRIFPLLAALVLLALFAVRALTPCEFYYSMESAPVLKGELPGLEKKFSLMPESLLEEGGVSAASRGDFLMLVSESDYMDELLPRAGAFSRSAGEVLLLAVEPDGDGGISSSRIYRYSGETGAGCWSLLSFGSADSKVRAISGLRDAFLPVMLLLGAGSLLVVQVIVFSVSRRRRKSDRCPTPEEDFSGEIPPRESAGPRCPVARAACGLLMFLSGAGAAVCVYVFFTGMFGSDPAGILLAAVMCAVLMVFAVTTLKGIRRGEVSRGRNAGVTALTAVLLVFLLLVVYSVFA